MTQLLQIYNLYNNLLDATSTLTTQEFVITSPVFKKVFTTTNVGTTETDFELQDITIIARAKGVR